MIRHIIDPRLAAVVSPGISYRWIDVNETVSIGIWHYYLHEHSWGWRYTKVVRAVDEIRKAYFAVGAFAEEGSKLVGAACINPQASPDGIDNGQLWLADFVVAPEYRTSVIAYALYKMCMSYALSRPERIFMSMENQDVRRIMPILGWKVLRESTNEIGDPTTIIEYPR